MITEETRRKLRAAGRKGGMAKVPKGFAKNKELAREAGKKSGRKKPNDKLAG